MNRRALVTMGLVGSTALAGGIQTNRHNLSATGPGPVKSIDEDEICVFCHAPHVVEDTRPGWYERTRLAAAYEPYQSPTMGSSPGQPNGVSRQCLSCHDGTIASVAASPRATLPRPRRTGDRRPRSDRGSDVASRLAGSHPISIAHAEAVRERPGKAAATALQPDSELLDADGRVQCTSCHDPHDDPASDGAAVPPFWRGSSFSEVCTSCHIADLVIPGHDDPGALPLGCGSCHVGHGMAGQPLLPAAEEEACYECHGDDPRRVASTREGRLGPTARPTGVEDLFDLPWTHPVDATLGVHEPGEDPGTPGRRHVECADCHPTHGAPARAAYGGASPTGGPQLTATGDPAQDVCYRCHGASGSLPYGQSDKSAEFDPSSASFHPIEAPATGRSPSLLPPWRSGARMSCTDCHGASTGDTRRGPHGSRNRWLLRETYVVQDATPESPATYAACYACHDRGTILADTTFEGHSSHVLSASVSCWSCHDSHASPDAPGLIRFGEDARYGRVDPSSSGRLEYEPTTRSCYLTCHGVDHDPLGYP